jgi:hypothetical protein
MVFQNPYFGRMWTVQELAFSRSCTVLCGGAKIPFNWFSHGFDLAFTYLDGTWEEEYGIDIREGNPKLLAFTIYETTKHWVQGSDVLGGPKVSSQIPLDLLMMVRFLRCSNPRDKVFALYNLFEINDPEAFSRPDYSKPVAQVCVETTVAVIKQMHGSLEVLSYAFNSAQDISLPSWVPDWTYPGGFRDGNMVPIANQFSRSRLTPPAAPPVSFSKDSLRCISFGRLCGTVVDVERLNDEPLGRLREWARVVSNRISQAQVITLPRLFHREICACEERDLVMQEFLFSEGVKSFAPEAKRAWEELKPAVVDRRSWCSLGECLARSYDKLPLNSLVRRRDTKLFALNDDYIGFCVHGNVREGDAVAFFAGMYVAVILRQVQVFEDKYQIVGYAHVFGKMDRLVCADDLSKLKKFVIV